MEKIRILIADDHQMIRDGLRVVLERQENFSVTAEASNGSELFFRLNESAIDIVLLDISMPELNGMDAAEKLQNEFPSVKVIILSMHDDLPYITRCLELGVMGYVLKSESANEIVRAINAVSQGKKFYSDIVSNKILDNYKNEMRVKTKGEKKQTEITDREKEILYFVMQGLTNQMIADQLFISYRTVETHRSNLMRKLDAKNSVDLVNKARAMKLIDENFKVG